MNRPEGAPAGTARASAVAPGNMGEGPVPWGFIALMAYLTSTIALGIDAMMASLPEIGADLIPSAPGQAQLVFGAFFLGIGVGTFFAGPLSDRFGRRPLVLGGLVIYALGAFVASQAQSLEWLLVGRVIQGFGAAAPRVVTMAIIRDKYEGARLASTVSLVMMFFVLVPGVAPAMGAIVSDAFGWRAVFVAFMLFAAVGMIWFWLAQPETLREENKHALSLRGLASSVREVASYKQSWLTIGLLTLILAQLYALLSSFQPVMDQAFDLDRQFPYIFGAISLLGGVASLINSRIVARLGAAFVARRSMTATAVITLCAALAIWLIPLEEQPHLALGVFLLWTASAFGTLGFMVGNLNALAMQPLGHVAGMAATVISAATTLLAGAISVPIALSFDGTPRPLLLGCAVLAICVFGLSRVLPTARPAEENG
ncbi:multidrug effflux MFS transporter [Alphaproteobacteria bacterium KMM 3653]|uniref:Multidrug effflux MFS transporter n=1 Tax=Harenicola maris TaxID=2841044 RepID=A0AAP2CPL8_9RHOB|nr:multidrug effflux MFS transporter [Harenicola maris]